jgi:hypothetical protein
MRVSWKWKYNPFKKVKRRDMMGCIHYWKWAWFWGNRLLAVSIASLMLLTLLSTALIFGAGEVQAAVIFHDDFESGWGSWSTDNGVWEVGTPTAGPPAVHSGSQCAGTVLGGNYPPDTDSRLISHAIHLPEVGPGEEIHLRFWDWFSYAVGDQGYVQVSVYSSGRWGAWENLGLPITSSSPAWSLCDRDLTPYAPRMGESTIKIAFYHTADSKLWFDESTGWYIDDVEIAQSHRPALTGDFESGWGEWGAENGIWEVGIPTAGPTGAHSGSQCAGTILGGNYPGATRSRLISPWINLPAVSGGEEIHLRFWDWFSYADGDQGYVQVSVYSSGTWGAWENLGLPITSSSPAWSLCDRDLTSYAGQRIRIAFYHTADSRLWFDESTGWYIDDVEVAEFIPALTGDFESGWGEWGAENGIWEVGIPTAGPPVAHSGLQCAGTILGGNYPGATRSRLISPSINLPVVSGGEEIHLRFWDWFSYADGDQGYVQVSVCSGGTWGAWETVGPTIVSSSSVWSFCDRDLTSYAGQRIRIAFYHTADSKLWFDESTGWYIDDVVITAAITGQITEVNCDLLAYCTVCLYHSGTLIGCTISDSGGYYELHAIAAGTYDVIVDKAGWRPESQQVTIYSLGTIALNFIGGKGLIPNTPTVQYVAQCSNHYLYPYGNCGLSVQRVAAVSNAYLYPVSE